MKLLTSTNPPGRLTFAELTRHWEWEVLALALFVFAAFFWRLADIPLLGEETRRAIIAREMEQSGDWIVPRQQGELRLTKPPMQYWAIATSTSLFGAESLFAIRFPAAVTTLLTALVIYAYCRNFLSRAGALAAGLSFLTMGEILHSSRFAQIEPLFTLFLSASLLVWHSGYLRGWSPGVTWGAGYALAALAALTKGPQAPIYFVAGTVIHLILLRDWRMLFSKAHVCGLAIFALLVGAWLVPLWREVGTALTFHLWFGESLGRSNVFQPNFFVHLARFPLEIFLCAFPCSLALLVYLSREFRSRLGDARLPAQFLFGCAAFAFPTCWIPPGGEPRYLMPIYPCLGCLAGIVWDRLSLDWSPRWNSSRAWQFVRLAAAGLMIACVAGMLVWIFVKLPGKVGPLPCSVGGALAYLLVALALTVLFWRASRPAARSPFLAHTVFACFLALTYNWCFVGRLQKLCYDMEQVVAEARNVVPPGTPMVSLDWVQHRFAFYYPGHVRVLPYRETGELPAEGAYFCLDSFGEEKPHLPFQWEMLSVVPVDRYRRDDPTRAVVVIGRRLPVIAATARVTKHGDTAPGKR